MKSFESVSVPRLKFPNFVCSYWFYLLGNLIKLPAAKNLNLSFSALDSQILKHDSYFSAFAIQKYPRLILLLSYCYNNIGVCLYVWERGVSLKKKNFWWSVRFIYFRIHILKVWCTKGLKMHPEWETPVNWLLSWQNGNFKLHRQLIAACLWNDRSIIFSFVCIESQSPWHSVLHYPPATNHMMMFKEWRALSIMGDETHRVLFG